MTITKEQLETLYVGQGLTVRQCAESLGLPTCGGISWRLKKFGIPARPVGFQVGNRIPGDRPPEKAGGWKGGKNIATCDHCGNQMERFPSLIREKNFCNRSCKRDFIPVNMVGKKFGALTVVKYVGKDNKYGRTQWECVCECGGKKTVKTNDLNSQGVSSCGCKNGREGKDSHNWRGGKIEIKCAYPPCGKSKLIFPSQAKLYAKKYCNNECRGAHRSEIIRGEDNARFKEKIRVPCAQCGKELELLPCMDLLYKVHFCKGTDCISKWQSENRLGSQNSNWRGGLSFEPYPVTWNFRLREMIRDRDGRICRVCSEKENGTRLAVHHVDYRKDNLDPDNLVSLCHQCHVKTNGHRDEWMKFFSAGVAATA